MNAETAMNQPDLTTAPPSSANEIDTVAEQIAMIAREMSTRIDNDRRLPDELVALLGESGLLRAGAPAEVRALELPPGVALRCAEDGGARQRLGRLVRLDRDHQQPAGRVLARVQPRCAVR